MDRRRQATSPCLFHVFSLNGCYLIVIRIEWLHAKASVARWSEEESLLCEESRRILASFCAKQAIWQTQVENLQGNDRLHCGQKAFAVSQREVAKKLADNARLHYQEVLHGAKNTFEVLAEKK